MGVMTTKIAAARVITGTPGADRLASAGPDDTLSGGRGNDVYVVTHAGVVVSEDPGAGTDLVQASVSFALAACRTEPVLAAGRWQA
jgi:Ca2+-binding RTX toxin-like protein